MSNKKVVVNASWIMIGRIFQLALTFVTTMLVTRYLGPGEYEVTIEFDAGQPIVWPWHVYYGVSAPETTPDAPAVLNDAGADVSTWFAGEALTYSVVSGPAAWTAAF